MQLQIKQKFLDGDVLTLDAMMLLISKEHRFDKKSILNTKNTKMYFGEKKLNELEKKLNEFQEKTGDNTRYLVAQENIHSLVTESKFLPYSYYFIISFFSEVFGENFFKKYKGEDFYRKKSYLWFLKKKLMDFLNIFTNIEDLKKEFLEKISSFDEIEFITDKKEALLYYFIYESFPKKNNKKLEPLLQGIEIGLLDGSIFLFNRIKKYSIVNMLNSKKQVLYQDEIQRIKNMHKNKLLF